MIRLFVKISEPAFTGLVTEQLYKALGANLVLATHAPPSWPLVAGNPVVQKRIVFLHERATTCSCAIHPARVPGRLRRARPALPLFQGHLVGLKLRGHALPALRAANCIAAQKLSALGPCGTCSARCAPCSLIEPKYTALANAYPQVKRHGTVLTCREQEGRDLA